MFILLKKTFLILFSSFILNGCYTVIWHPTEELPNNKNSVKNEAMFYDVDNFGVFNPYYNSPWWLNPDNDFLIDNFNTLAEISYVIDKIIIVNEITRDNLQSGIPPIILVTPAGKISKDKTKERKTVSPIVKSRNNTAKQNKVRNNNGGRKSSKGRR